MVLNIVINEEPFSLNGAYSNVKGKGRILTKKAESFKKIVSLQTSIALNKSENFPIRAMKDFYFSTEIYFFSPKFLTKEKDISQNKPDTSNCIKLLEDGIFEALGIDDYLSIDFDCIRFRYSKEPKIIVILKVHDISRLNNPLFVALS